MILVRASRIDLNGARYDDQKHCVVVVVEMDLPPHVPGRGLAKDYARGTNYAKDYARSCCIADGHLQVTNPPEDASTKWDQILGEDLIP